MRYVLLGYILVLFLLFTGYKDGAIPIILIFLAVSGMMIQSNRGEK